MKFFIATGLPGPNVHASMSTLLTVAKLCNAPGVTEVIAPATELVINSRICGGPSPPLAEAAWAVTCRAGRCRFAAQTPKSTAAKLSGSIALPGHSESPVSAVSAKVKQSTLSTCRTKG